MDWKLAGLLERKNSSWPVGRQDPGNNRKAGIPLPFFFPFLLPFFGSGGLGHIQMVLLTIPNSVLRITPSVAQGGGGETYVLLGMELGLVAYLWTISMAPLFSYLFFEIYFCCVSCLWGTCYSMEKTFFEGSSYPNKQNSRKRAGLWESAFTCRRKQGLWLWTQAGPVFSFLKGGLAVRLWFRTGAHSEASSSEAGKLLTSPENSGGEKVYGSE